MSNCCFPRAVLFSVVMILAEAKGQSETVIHSFSGPDGAYPYFASLTVGPDGALYGTTTYGGGLGIIDCGYGGCGTVFRLSGSGSNWTESVLWSFGGSPDGAYPEGNVVFDRYGALYGTTLNGGNSSCPGGCGTVFKLTPSGGPTWNETVLYRFTGTPDGEYPAGQVVFGPNGALYSATYEGGTLDIGTVFQLAPSGGATWNETVLHSFGTTPNDGAYPYASGVIFGADGALYGTTENGGGLGITECGYGGCGTVFRLAPGNWQETVIHSFSGGSDGSEPSDPVTFGPDGALYGTTPYGGTASYCSGCGTVFRLAPTGSLTHWTETVIYAFGGEPNYNDGAYPYAGVIFGRDGALYSMTYYGGTSGSCTFGCGTIFKLTPSGGSVRSWSESVLHSFTGDPDGEAPYLGSLTFGRDGALYGMTYSGGASDEGTVFQQAP